MDQTLVEVWNIVPSFISNRLIIIHGHILSLLFGIPRVVIDPVNHKITSYMKSWTGGIDNILVADSSEDALNKAIGLLQKLDDKLPQVAAFRNSIGS